MPCTHGHFIPRASHALLGCDCGPKGTGVSTQEHTNAVPRQEPSPTHNTQMYIFVYIYIYMYIYIGRCKKELPGTTSVLITGAGARASPIL